MSWADYLLQVCKTSWVQFDRLANVRPLSTIRAVRTVRFLLKILPDTYKKRDEPDKMKPMCMQEKRRGETVTTSYNVAKSSKEVDYSEKSGKVEPKFEPRISMYKYDPLQGVSDWIISKPGLVLAV